MASPGRPRVKSDVPHEKQPGMVQLLLDWVVIVDQFGSQAEPGKQLSQLEQAPPTHRSHNPVVWFCTGVAFWRMGTKRLAKVYEVALCCSSVSVLGCERKKSRATWCDRGCPGLPRLRMPCD